MAKQKKKGGNSTATKLAIAAAILTLINSLLKLVDKLLELLSK